MNSLLMQLQTCIVHLSQSGIECSFQAEYTNHFVFPATKMFRFNEGDIADDAAAYLLAIKESVCRNKIILYFCCSHIFCFGYFIIFSECYFVLFQGFDESCGGESKFGVCFIDTSIGKFHVRFVRSVNPLVYINKCCKKFLYHIVSRWDNSQMTDSAQDLELSLLTMSQLR